MTPSDASSSDVLPTRTAAAARRPLFAGVDVGGTSIKLGVVDNDGATIASTRISTLQERGPEDAIDRIHRSLVELTADLGGLEALSGVGLGTPGTMDIPAGVILEPPNLPAWRHFPVRDRLSAVSGLPVAYANDGGAAAYGEFWVGSGREHASIVMLTLGTGVGGGIIVGDQSLDGQHSHGSECGHLVIDTDPRARVCSCGRPGHLEAYCSATAVKKRMAELLEDPAVDSSLRTRVDELDELTPLMLAEEAEAGDQVANELVLATADYLALAIANIAHVIDPNATIIGGAMTFGRDETNVGRQFLERTRRRVRELVFPVIAENLVIDYARLGGAAGYIGAAGIARMAFPAGEPR